MKVFLNCRLFADFLLWVFCIGFHKYISNGVYNLGMYIGLDKSPPLFDTFQHLSPNLQYMRFIPEILHIIPIATLFGYILYYQNERSVMALRTMLTRHGALMVLRAIFFSSTLLPDSSMMCKLSALPGSCFDLIFSGHTTAILLTTYILRDYYNIGNGKYILLQLINLITCVMVILCRNHYTIDVLVSIITTNYIYDL